MTEKVFRDFNFQDKLLFTFVGALEFRKGVHLIIEALSGFKTVPNAHLIIAGTGDIEYEKTGEFNKEHNLTASVTQISWLNHEKLRTVFAITDIFVSKYVV